MVLILHIHTRKDTSRYVHTVSVLLLSLSLNPNTLFLVPSIALLSSRLVRCGCKTGSVDFQRQKPINALGKHRPIKRSYHMNKITNVLDVPHLHRGRAHNQCNTGKNNLPPDPSYVTLSALHLLMHLTVTNNVKTLALPCCHKLTLQNSVNTCLLRPHALRGEYQHRVAKPGDPNQTC